MLTITGTQTKKNLVACLVEGDYEHHMSRYKYLKRAYEQHNVINPHSVTTTLDFEQLRSSATVYPPGAQRA